MEYFICSFGFFYHENKRKAPKYGGILFSSQEVWISKWNSLSLSLASARLL
jgi:hypothetical protein